MSVLLTGGTGFIGLNVAEALLDEGVSVIIYAASPPRPEAEAALQGKRGKCVFVRGDVLDKSQLDSVWREHGIASVIHGAAVTPDERRELDGGAGVVQVNCIGTLNVLETALKHRADKFVYLSSIAVYGTSTVSEPLLDEEGTARKPENLYEITKFAAERMALRYKQLTGLNVTAARLGDIFGSWEYETGVRDVMSAPFQTTRMAMLGRQAWLPRRGHKSWVYCRDVAGAVVALWKASALKHEVYNVSSSYQWSVADWCGLLAERYPDFSYAIAKSPEEANVRLFADNAPMNIDRLREDTGFEARYDMRQAFDDYMNWADKHAAMITG